MVIKVFTGQESKDRTQTLKFRLSGLVKVNKVTVNTGEVEIIGVNGEEVTVKVSGGSSVRKELVRGTYTPSHSKYVTESRSSGSPSFSSSIYYSYGGYSGLLYKSGGYTSRQTGGYYTPPQSKTVTTSRSGIGPSAVWSWTGSSWSQVSFSDGVAIGPSSISYNSGGYSGTLYKGSISWGWPSAPSGRGSSVGEIRNTYGSASISYSGTVYSSATDTRTYTYTQSYAGTVTKPAVDTREYDYFYKYDVTFDFIGNQAPVGIPIPTWETVIDQTKVIDVTQHFNDPEGDAITLSAVSSDTSIVDVSGETEFTLKSRKVGKAEVTFTATDARGESSDIVMTVNVANNIPVLTLDPIAKTEVFEGQAIDLTGSVTDSDRGHIVNIRYDLNGSYEGVIKTYISEGVQEPFSKALLLKDKRLWDGHQIISEDLSEGVDHTITVWAEDDNGGKSAEKTYVFKVTHNRAPGVELMQDRTGYADVVQHFPLSDFFTDPDGDVLKYKPTVSNGEIAEVGISPEGELIILPKKSGVTLVTVEADDGKGGTVSGSFTLTVLNRDPSLIVKLPDGSELYENEDLGDRVSAFKLHYTVEDLDITDNLVVSEIVNGEIMKVIDNANRGEEYVFDLAEHWSRVNMGDNTIKIVAQDSAGGYVEKVHTFRSTGNELRFSLKQPMETSLPARQIVVSGTPTVAEGAILTVLVCNNGFDVEPTWEDATDAFLNVQAHQFKNETKTADNWGVNVEFKILQGDSTELSYIDGFGFSFD